MYTAGLKQLGTFYVIVLKCHHYCLESTLRCGCANATYCYYTCWSSIERVPCVVTAPEFCSSQTQ